MENKLFQKRLEQLREAPLNFDAGPDDTQLITQIALRAIQRYGQQFDGVSIAMDITACHLNGCPLRLMDLLKADDFNFGHDVLGIRKHLNRDTGKLEDFFLPRFAAPQHDLYETGDEDAPDCIKDRNGEVVLGLCRKCHRGECELTEPCQPKEKQA